MGWCSGSRIAEEIYEEVRNHIPEGKRKKIANKIYDIFCERDADDWDISSNLIKDAKIKYEE